MKPVELTKYSRPGEGDERRKSIDSLAEDAANRNNFQTVQNDKNSDTISHKFSDDESESKDNKPSMKDL